jgi:hypothetical protein
MKNKDEEKWREFSPERALVYISPVIETFSFYKYKISNNARPSCIVHGSFNVLFLIFFSKKDKI